MRTSWDRKGECKLIQMNSHVLTDGVEIGGVVEGEENVDEVP